MSQNYGNHPERPYHRHLAHRVLAPHNQLGDPAGPSTGRKRPLAQDDSSEHESHHNASKARPDPGITVAYLKRLDEEARGPPQHGPQAQHTSHSAQVSGSRGYEAAHGATNAPHAPHAPHSVERLHPHSSAADGPPAPPTVLPFTCDQCQNIFFDEDEHKNHIHNGHYNFKKQMKANHIHNGHNNLKKKMKAEQEQEERKIFECHSHANHKPGEETKFLIVGAFMDHLERVHRQYWCLCPECEGKVFSNVKEYVRHRYQRVWKDSDCRWNYCPRHKHYNTKAEAQKAMKKDKEEYYENFLMEPHKSGTVSLLCEYGECNYHGPNDEHLAAHRKTEHNAQTHRCAYCFHEMPINANHREHELDKHRMDCNKLLEDRFGHNDPLYQVIMKEQRDYSRGTHSIDVLHEAFVDWLVPKRPGHSPWSCKSPSCGGFEGTNTMDFTRHIRTKHNSWVCLDQECTNNRKVPRFTRAPDLHNHLEEKHKKGNQGPHDVASWNHTRIECFLCKVAQKTDRNRYFLREEFEVHLQNYHTHIEGEGFLELRTTFSVTYACTYCFEGQSARKQPLITLDHYLQHMEDKHQDKKEAQCPFCLYYVDLEWAKAHEEFYHSREKDHLPQRRREERALGRSLANIDALDFDIELNLDEFENLIEA